MEDIWQRGLIHSWKWTQNGSGALPTSASWLSRQQQHRSPQKLLMPRIMPVSSQSQWYVSVVPFGASSARKMHTGLQHVRRHRSSDKKMHLMLGW